MTSSYKCLMTAVVAALTLTMMNTSLAQQPATEGAWADQIKNPCKYFQWGADERIRQEFINNPFFSDADPPGHEWNFGRYRTRVWGKVLPAEPLEFNLRLSWEWRYWEMPDSKDNNQWNDVVFDQVNLKLKKPADLPLTVTIGRQEIILGDGWLVLEGTPLDGSTTIYFDAARFTLDLKQVNTTLDTIFIYQFGDPDHGIPPIDSKSMHQIEQDETGLILYATNKSIERTEISPYFMYKHSNDAPYLSGGKKGAPRDNGDNGDLYTLGARATHDFNDNIKGRLEGAYQWGSRQNPAMFPTSEDVSAWGFNSQLAYHFNDSWKNVLKVQAEHLSGDDPDSATIEQFNPLWGRWPQWSEYYVYTYATETRIAEVTNFWRLGCGWDAKPFGKMSTSLMYHAVWADQNTREGAAGFSDNGKFRGHLFTGLIRYKFNRFLAAHVLGEYFLTGDYYDDNDGLGGRNDDNGVYARFELMATF